MIGLLVVRTAGMVGRQGATPTATRETRPTILEKCSTEARKVPFESHTGDREALGGIGAARATRATHA
jgi:hypothetical protein